MLEVDEIERVVRLRFVFSHKCHARLFGARIELENNGLHGRILELPINKPDRERIQLMDPRPSLTEKSSRSGGMAGHQRFVMPIQNKNHCGHNESFFPYGKSFLETEVSRPLQIASREALFPSPMLQPGITTANRFVPTQSLSTSAVSGARS